MSFAEVTEAEPLDLCVLCGQLLEFDVKVPKRFLGLLGVLATIDLPIKVVLPTVKARDTNMLSLVLRVRSCRSASSVSLPWYSLHDL